MTPLQRRLFKQKTFPNREIFKNGKPNGSKSLHHRPQTRMYTQTHFKAQKTNAREREKKKTQLFLPGDGVKFQSDRASPTFGPCSAISLKLVKERNEGEMENFSVFSPKRSNHFFVAISSSSER